MRLALLLTFAAIAEAQCPRLDLEDANGNPNDLFGNAVAVSHPHMVVAARWDDAQGYGAGTVFTWTYDDSSHSWVAEGELLSSITSGSDSYGYCLDVTDEWLAIGAVGDDVSSVIAAGSITMFRRQGGGWVEHSVLYIPNAHNYSQLGTDLSLDGHHLVAGSWDGGFAWHYETQTDTWDFVQSLDISIPNEWAARQICVAGDHCILSNPSGDAPFGHPGAAHVFTWNGTSWSEDHPPLMSGVGPSLFLHGTDVATDGTTFATSSWSSAFGNGGSVHVYRKLPGGQIVIVDRIDGEFVSFGRRGLEVFENRLTISSYDANRVYVYEWDDVLDEYVLWKEYDQSDVGVDPGDDFGNKLAIDGRWLLAGSKRSNNSRGRAFLWDLGACTPIGTEYCDPAVVNTTGLPGSVHAEGVPLAGGYPLSIVGSDLPNGQASLLVTSQAQGSITPPGSIGVLCLGSPLGRFRDPEFVSGGEVRFDVDTLDMPMQPNVAIQPGETWNFQIWYRDSGVSNFTSATEVSFQ